MNTLHSFVSRRALESSLAESTFHASFEMRQVRFYSGEVDDEINEVQEGLSADLYFDSDPAFFHFISALRKVPQLSPKPNYLKELIFLINDIKHNERLVNREVKRLLKNELLYIHNQPF